MDANFQSKSLLLPYVSVGQQQFSCENAI
jgi:hypothetical protein